MFQVFGDSSGIIALFNVRYNLSNYGRTSRLYLIRQDRLLRTFKHLLDTFLLWLRYYLPNLNNLLLHSELELFPNLRFI